MSTITWARLALAGIALLVWGYGVQQDVREARLAGMALLAVAVLLRFFGPRPPRRGESSPEE